jgi:hypothetical protein
MKEPTDISDWIKPPLLPIEKGRRLRLSLPRRQVGDMLHFAQKVPSVPVQRRMRVGPLLHARREALPRPKWVNLFAKGFSVVAAETPRLRQAYMNFPWPHIYEHPESIATIAVEREYRGEEAVFFPKFFAPDKQPIGTLESYLNYFKEAPLDEISEYWLGLFVSRFWRPLRRSMWWFALNVSGDIRARVFGTFSISVYSGLGAESLHPIAPITSLLNFGTIGPDGQVDLRLVYDHRVLDGATVARALKRLEEALNDQVASELDVEPPLVFPFPNRGAA